MLILLGLGRILISFILTAYFSTYFSPAAAPPPQVQYHPTNDLFTAPTNDLFTGDPLLLRVTRLTTCMQPD